MFDRFTDRARQLLDGSHREARRFSHDYIGTDHVTMAFPHVPDCVANDALKSIGVDPVQLAAAVEKRVRPGATPPVMPRLPFTPVAKKTLEEALRMARGFGLNYVGTEHVLLGLAWTDGPHTEAFHECGVEPVALREAVAKLLGATFEEPADEAPPPRPRRLAAGLHFLAGAAAGVGTAVYLRWLERAPDWAAWLAAAVVVPLVLLGHRIRGEFWLGAFVGVVCTLLLLA